jgi:hypothetical protein
VFALLLTIIFEAWLASSTLHFREVSNTNIEKLNHNPKSLLPLLVLERCGLGVLISACGKGLIEDVEVGEGWSYRRPRRG